MGDRQGLTGTWHRKDSGVQFWPLRASPCPSEGGERGPAGRREGRRDSHVGENVSGREGRSLPKAQPGTPVGTQARGCRKIPGVRLPRRAQPGEARGDAGRSCESVALPKPRPLLSPTQGCPSPPTPGFPPRLSLGHLHPLPPIWWSLMHHQTELGGRATHQTPHSSPSSPSPHSRPPLKLCSAGRSLSQLPTAPPSGQPRWPPTVHSWKAGRKL